jgi:hypothetical protein
MILPARLARRGSLLGLAVLGMFGVLVLVIWIQTPRCAEEEDLCRAFELRVALERKSTGTIARIATKVEVSKQVLAGELTLLEAAALFRAADQQPPVFLWEEFRRAFPGATDEERHCREVIVWVERVQSKKDPCLAEATRVALEAQLAEQLKRGPLRLPEASKLRQPRIERARPPVPLAKD